MMRRALVLAVLFPALAAAAAAPSPPRAEEPDLVEALVVRARTPGPAWWRVSDADTTVWVLGAPEAVPAKLSWTSRPMEARIRGANALILPARRRIGLIDIIKLVFTLKNQIYGQDKIEKRLPADLNARYQAALKKVGGAGRGPALGEGKDGADPKTVMLSFMLQGAFERPLELRNNEPEATATRIASRLSVHRETVGDYEMMPIIRDLFAMSESDQQACLAAQVAEVEGGERARQSLAKAWAEGDVPSALASLPRERLCSIPQAQQQEEQAVSDTVEAISKALKRPGKAVAIVELMPLLRAGGVLDQLQSQGLTITPPADLDD